VASVTRRLNTPELKHLKAVATQACLQQRRELDRAGEKPAELEPEWEEDAWG
jgi:hypothetical protein